MAAFDVAELGGEGAYKLLTTALVPRPIAWVSTVSTEGAPNLAPYSFFNAVASDPPTVMFAPGAKADGTPKDSLRNARDTGEFVVNLADEPLAEALNETSAAWAHGVDEFIQTGLDASSLEPRPAPTRRRCAGRARVPRLAARTCFRIGPRRSFWVRCWWFTSDVTCSVRTGSSSPNATARWPDSDATSTAPWAGCFR